MRRFPSLALMLLVLFPAVASAQTDVTEPTPPPSPEVRVDVVNGPGLGGTTAHEGTTFSTSIGLSFAHRSGHGARLFASGLQTELFGGGLLGPHPAHVEELALDASYAYRFRLTGDDRSGLGLELYGGMSAASIHFHQGTSGLCFGGSCDVPVVPESVADGWHLGANAGASLDFRVHGFVFGLDVRARGLIAIEHDESTEQMLQADVIGGIHLGFGFY